MNSDTPLHIYCVVDYLPVLVHCGASLRFKTNLDYAIEASVKMQLQNMLSIRPMHVARTYAWWDLPLRSLPLVHFPASEIPLSEYRLRLLYNYDSSISQEKRWRALETQEGGELDASEWENAVFPLEHAAKELLYSISGH